jgi:hypothetical protein
MNRLLEVSDREPLLVSIRKRSGFTHLFEEQSLFFVLGITRAGAQLMEVSEPREYQFVALAPSLNLINRSLSA